ncbi:MAG: hypothetical protein Q8Q31_02490 [Nanoarchaeota archaeon]|nr:hypothetical protein [Nanoarchaeota archaeon]
MSEEVHTGGLKRFSYPKDAPKLKEEHKREIDEAYEAYYERKREEKRKRKLMWIFLVLALLILAGIALIFI